MDCKQCTGCDLGKLLAELSGSVVEGKKITIKTIKDKKTGLPKMTITRKRKNEQN